MQQPESHISQTVKDLMLDLYHAYSDSGIKAIMDNEFDHETELRAMLTELGIDYTVNENDTIKFKDPIDARTYIYCANAVAYHIMESMSSKQADHLRKKYL